MAMIFQGEHTSKKRTAHVFKRQEENDYIVVCYELGVESLSDTFDLEQLADDWAEDWVLNATAGSSNEQQTTVSRGCCD